MVEGTRDKFSIFFSKFLIQGRSPQRRIKSNHQTDKDLRQAPLTSVAKEGATVVAYRTLCALLSMSTDDQSCGPSKPRPLSANRAPPTTVFRDEATSDETQTRSTEPRQTRIHNKLQRRGRDRAASQRDHVTTGRLSINNARTRRREGEKSFVRHRELQPLCTTASADGQRQRAVEWREYGARLLLQPKSGGRRPEKGPSKNERDHRCRK